MSRSHQERLERYWTRQLDLLAKARWSNAPTLAMRCAGMTLPPPRSTGTRERRSWKRRRQGGRGARR